MINGNTVLAIIPARGGSKGVPRKNIRLLASKPLLAWSIEEAKKSKYIDRLILSSEDEEIIKVSKEFGCEAPFLRPKELASDITPSSDVILHAIEWLEINQNQKFDIFILLQPTSPFRNSDQIDIALENFTSNPQTKCLVSVKVVEENPYWMKILDYNHYLKNMTLGKVTFTRRQELPKIYILNGAIYIMRPSDFKILKSFDVDFTIPLIMDKKTSIDIDDEEDFAFAEIVAIKGL